MSWRKIKLGEVIKHRKGFIIIDDDTEYKLCRVQLHRRGVVLRGLVKGSTIRTKKQQVCKAGDFLVAEMDAKVGGYGFVPEELEGAIVSSHYFLFELDETKIRPKYLEVISQLQILQDQIKAVGSTNYAAIRPAHVLNWEIPITDIQHQIEIEKLFEAATGIGEQLTTTLTHQLHLVKQLRQAFLREAMQGKLLPRDPADEPASALLARIRAEKERLRREGRIKKEKPLPPIKPEELPFEAPEGWVWCRLGEVSAIVRGGSPRPAGDPRFYGGEIPFLKVGDLTGYEGKYCNGYTYTIKKTGLTKTRFVEANTLMLTNSGATLGVPRICTFPTTFNDGIAAFLHIDELDKEFLFYYLRDKSDYFLKEASRGQGQPNLNTDIISETLLPLPPLPEQRRIVARLDALMQSCDALEASIRAGQERNAQLLQQVLREALGGK